MSAGRLSILDVARAYPFIDGDNVFMLGNSRGGMMTYLALAHGAKVNAAIVNCGVADVRTLEDDVVARVLPEGLSAQERRRQYERRSAVVWPERLNAPLLIVHGEKDPSVPVQDVRRYKTSCSGSARPTRSSSTPKLATAERAIHLASTMTSWAGSSASDVDALKPARRVGARARSAGAWRAGRRGRR